MVCTVGCDPPDLGLVAARLCRILAILALSVKGRLTAPETVGAANWQVCNRARLVGPCVVHNHRQAEVLLESIATLLVILPCIGAPFGLQNNASPLLVVPGGFTMSCALFVPAPVTRGRAHREQITGRTCARI